MRIPIPLVTLGVLLCSICTAFAAPPISDGVIPVNPAVTTRIVREGLVDVVCTRPPSEAWPLECAVPNVGAGGLRFGHDALGFYYEVALNGIVLPSGDTALVLRRIGSNGTEEVLAYLLRTRCDVYPCNGWSINFEYYSDTASHFDVTNGALLLVVKSQRNTPQGGDEAKIGIIEISGFPKLFDTLLTFLPGGGSLTALTPAHPDGFRSADSLQVWTGNLRTLPDWSQAQPLTCNAATNPTPGQLVTITDTLPDPAAGEGRYYVMASQSGADRRLGRQYVNGAFAARDPNSLPACF